MKTALVLQRSKERLERIHKLAAYIQADMGIGFFSGDFFDEIHDNRRELNYQETLRMTYEQLCKKYPSVPGQLLYRVIDAAAHHQEASQLDKEAISEHAQSNPELLEDLEEWL